MEQLLTQDNITSAFSRLFDTDKKWITVDFDFDFELEKTEVYVNIYKGRLDKLSDSEIDCIIHNKFKNDSYIIKRKFLFITLWVVRIE